MSRLARLLLCAFLCSSVTQFLLAQAKEEKPATASITGRITFDKQPLPGVTVVLEAGGMMSLTQSSARRPVTAKTDQDGRYRLSGIAAGQHLVSPRALAYALPFDGLSGRVGKNVTLNDGEQIEGIDFTLVRGGVIAGRITDHLDHPVIAQRINLQRFAGAGRAGPMPFSAANFFMFETDDRGMYRLFGLQAGRYTLSVGEGGGQNTIIMGRTGKFYPRTFYPDARTEQEAKAIEVTEGGEVTGIDIKLPKAEKAYEARGRIIDASTGAPLVGMALSYRSVSNNPASMGSFGITQERTNAQGEFVLQGLVPGKYMAAMQALETTSEYYSDPLMFEVQESDTEGLELKASRGAVISGVVVIEGATDPAILKRVTEVRVMAFPATPATPGAAPPMPTLSFGSNRSTNPDGTFRLVGVRPGKNRINPSSVGALMVARIERDGVEIPSVLEVTAGEQITGIKVVMIHGSGIIRGQVNVVNGTLSPDAQYLVSARRITSSPSGSGGGTRPAQVDARGKFVLEGIAPGEYELVLSPMGEYMVVSPSGKGNSPLRSVRQKVMVGAGETPVTITLDLGEKKEGQQ